MTPGTGKLAEPDVSQLDVAGQVRARTEEEARFEGCERDGCNRAQGAAAFQHFTR